MFSPRKVNWLPNNNCAKFCADWWSGSQFFRVPIFAQALHFFADGTSKLRYMKLVWHCLHSLCFTICHPLNDSRCDTNVSIIAMTFSNWVVLLIYLSKLTRVTSTQTCESRSTKLPRSHPPNIRYFKDRWSWLPRSCSLISCQLDPEAFNFCFDGWLNQFHGRNTALAVNLWRLTA